MNNKKKIYKIPRHLAIILDGNGRWANKKGLMRSVGHQEGAKRLKEVVKESFELGVEVLSVFAFSTENWSRPQSEIDYLFSLPGKFFADNINYFIDNDIKIMISGDYTKLPKETVLVLNKAINDTINCHSRVFNVALNYGGQDEIIQACKKIAQAYKEGLVDVNNLTPTEFESYLYTKDLPPVDFLIRTSNEKRISNFMLWQISYAEICFVKTLWPAFTKRELIKTFKEYSKRNRRFGGV